jgi:DNA replication protein DnaC
VNKELALSGIELYIGDLIEHESDRAILKSVIDILFRKNLSAIVLANVNFCSRQIDLIVVTNNLMLVLEAKSFSRPFRGSDNGTWEILTAGGWKPCDNYYLQTIKAMHALCDAMRKFKAGRNTYPKAALVFCPLIPPGSSDFRGDFKAKIIDIEELPKLFESSNQTPSWTVDTWREFVKHHRLNFVPNVEVAMDAKLLAADQTLNSYCKSFNSYYNTLAKEHILNEKTSQLLTEVKSSQADNKIVLLFGPSGCGKTLLTYRIGLELIEGGSIPIIIRAKDFDGNLHKIINKESSLLQAFSANILLDAIQRLNKNIVFIIDGYNECSKSLQKDLTRTVFAAAEKYEANIIFTSQKQIECGDTCELNELSILPPDDKLKLLIAKQASKSDLLDSQIALLNCIESGLEARLIGEIGSSIRPGMSRYAIFDTYIRKRLDEDATDGIRALSIVAKHLSDSISFSLSIRDLERIAEQQSVPTAILRHLHDANLLIQEEDYINFGHELYLDAFTAESIIRSSSSNIQSILKELQSPLNEERKHLIIGAIDNTSLLIQVLSEISDEKIIQACLSEHCGKVAYEWAENYCYEIIKKMNNEIEDVRFIFDDTTWTKVEAIQETLTSWSLQELSFINALPHVFIKGKFFDELLEAIKKMDAQSEIECERLEKQANKKLIGLRSGMFAFCYCGFGGKIGPAISNICRILDNGLMYRYGAKYISKNTANRLEDKSLSFGQLYLLLSLNRHCRDLDAPPIAHLLPGILRNYWRGASYHLRLCFMEAVQDSCWKISDIARKSLIEIIQEFPEPKNIGISTAITDALKSLGALQESENNHIKEVREIIKNILVNQPDDNIRALAFNIWANQIDHPYDGAYCQAWSELSIQEQKTLLFMAAQAADYHSFFISLLITNLAAFNDLSIISPILRWTIPPVTESSMPQQDVGNFIIANIALARLGYDLNETHLNDDVSDPVQAMYIVGKIFYWLNQIDLAMEERTRQSSKRMNIFMKHKHAASVIYEVNRANCCFEYHIPNLPGDENTLSSLEIYFSKELAEICRQALQDPEKQIGYFAFTDVEDVIKFLLDSLGAWGTQLDIQLIRKWTSYPKFGSHALKAIKCLEKIKIN